MKKLIVTLIILIFAMTSAVLATDPDIAILKPIGEPSQSGYQQYEMFDTEGNPIEPAQRTPQISFFSRLPERYDSRDYGYISPIRDQGQFGTCWAHAFVACAEANMIKKGYEESFNNYSELHLAYFCHKRNEAQGDGVDMFDTDPQTQYGYFGGGNGFYAAQFAENLQALAVESDFPYSMASNSADFSINEAYRDHADVHMVNYGKIIDAQDAKKAIMEYGAISVSYYDVNGYLSVDAAYYQNQYTKTNHEVAVVGWDDNFPVEKFNSNCRPQNPGAWLVKNSWGKTYGDFGYFWLSYEDPSLNLGYFYDFEPIGDASKVHTYNGGVATLMLEASKVANVFKAEEDQTVYAVGFDVMTYKRVPEEYEITVYVSNSQPTNPEKGTRKLTQSGSIDYDGFHHIELDTPVELKKDQYLSVVVKLTDASGNPAATLFEGGDNFTSRQGESWAYINGWIDAHNQRVGNYILKNSTIKAYYKTNTATVTFNSREAEHFVTQTVNIGECVSRPQDPVKDGYEFLGWCSNNTVTEEWNFSTPVNHDMVLFAKWSEPVNADIRVMSEYFSPSHSPVIGVSADCITSFQFYFLQDGKPFTSTQLLDSDDANKWLEVSLGLGNYGIFADIQGINGEEISTDTETFTVTDQTALSVHEGFINMVNIPPGGVDLYVAQYDDEGRFLNSKKIPFSSCVDKVIDAPKNYKNPRYFLWAAGEATPLCEDD